MGPDEVRGGFTTTFFLTLSPLEPAWLRVVVVTGVLTISTTDVLLPPDPLDTLLDEVLTEDTFTFDDVDAPEPKAAAPLTDPLWILTSPWASYTCWTGVKKLMGPEEVRGGFTTTFLFTESLLEAVWLVVWGALTMLTTDPVLDPLPELEVFDDEVLTDASFTLEPAFAAAAPLTDPDAAAPLTEPLCISTSP